MQPRTARRVLLLTLAASALAGTVRSARADPEELEQRLRADDIDTALRGRVRKSVERAVGFLVARQAPDGFFAEHGSPQALLAVTTVTLDAALALRHAGTPAALASCRRAVTWLFDAGGEERLAVIEGRTDDAGLALMLLLGTPGREDLARRIAAVLVGALDAGSGWWRHGSKGGSADHPSLEASQSAVTGLLAARAMGLAIPRALWVRHARALVETQTEKYHAWPLRFADADGIGATVGTLYGFGSLTAVQDVLRGDPELPADLAAGIAAALDRARSVLGRDAGRTLGGPLGTFQVAGDEEGLVLPAGRPPPFEVIGRQSGRRDPASPGTGACARLFAVERACRLGSLQTVDAFLEGKSVTGGTKPKTTAIPCYATAARWLVKHQRSDGGFAPEADDPKAAPSETDTALALLVLTRAVSAYHPVNPAPLDAKQKAPAPPPPKNG